MPSSLPRAAGSVRRRRFSAAGAVIALAAGLLSAAPSAWADTATPDPAAVEAAHIADAPAQTAGTPPTLSADQQARATAQAQAKSSGKPVPVDALTDAFTTTVANPDGSFTLTQSPQAQRVQKDGTWVPLDATLTANADGTLSPKAASGALILSAGGTGPVATMTGADGKKLSINAPFTLPAPTWSGTTAVYPNVAPDVDLDVTANPTGGAMTVLVVKSAAAAANPLVKNLKFTTTSSDLTVTADQGGNLAATDTSGQTQFSAPTPLMWDSSTASSSATPSASAAPSTATPSASAAATGATQALFVKSLAQAAPSDTSTTSADGTGGTSSATGPGDGAQTATIPATVSGSTISLTPSQSILSGTGTQYPVFIDPNWQQDNPWGEHFAWTQSAYPNQNNYDVSNTDYPGVGTCGTYPNGGSCSPNDTEETYYQFDTTALVGTTVYQATLDTAEHTSADMSCTTKYTIDLDWSGSLTNPTTWNSHPGSSQITSNSVGGARQTGCDGDVALNFNVTSTLQTAEEQQGKTQMTFKLHADDPSNVYGFKRFNHNAQLMVQYDTTPLAPNHLSTTDAGYYKSTAWDSFDYCTSAPAGVDSNWPWVNASGATLNAAPEGAQSQYRVNFRLWDDSSSTPAGDTYDTPANSPWVNTATAAHSDHLPVGAQASTGAVIKDGHAYGWLATGTDALPGVPSSPNSLVCHFRVDATAPTIKITNTGDFPPSGSGITPTKYTGQYGTIGVSVSDPAPSGYNGDTLAAQTSGVQCLKYGPDPTLTDTTTSTVCGSAISTLQIIAPHWGTNILYLQADDYAENFSQILPYAFYVPWNANGPAPKFGDTTGDSIPDVLTPGSDGNLYTHSLPNSSATTPTTSLAAVAAKSPDANADGKGWSSYQITHRGSVRGGMNVDDVIAHKPGDPTLYAYTNPGDEHIDGLFDNHLTLDRPACITDPANTNDTHCATYATDWSKTTQVLALGDIAHSALSQTSGTFQNRTGLLTTETTTTGNAALWFFPMASDQTLGTPVLLDTTTNWANLDLISPGDWNGSGRPGLWTRNRTTGAVSGYTFTLGSYTPVDTFGSPLPAVATLTAISTATPLNETLAAATYPVIGSEGDLTDSTGIPDLWTVSSTGALAEWTAGTSDGKNDQPVSTWATTSTPMGTTSAAANQWLMPAANYPSATLTQDAANLATTTAVAGPGYGTVTDNAASAKRAATLNGTNYLSSSTTAVDTSKDYTLSAWADLASTTGGDSTVLCQRDTAGKRCGIYLQYSSTQNGWALVAPSVDAYPMPAGSSYAKTAPGVTATPGKWTHLVAVFNATSKTMTLYVNGKFASTTTNASAWPATGPFLIGGTDNANNASNGSFNGSIADVRTYPSALTEPQITTLYNKPTG
ncbi:LamG domain-containing protein [Streptacidiphilus carbonis]|uniref:LamG domain-containing protein n=1 Tax=Streptacidiphilus carbonis TaxID=105422 RepID=UPI001269D34A|nr:LamG domain-containing protein [Streptacidiphilus carbonis]